VGALVMVLPSVTMRPAVESEAGVLSELVMRAKSHWGYTTEALERWRPELAVDLVEHQRAAVAMLQRADLPLERAGKLLE